MSQPSSYVPLEGQKNEFSSHDTSRAYFHHKDLAVFSEDVNNAAKKAFPNRGRSRYDTVNVCLIRWKDDVLGVQHELNALDYILQCYGFRTNVFLIPKLNSHWTLMREVLDFIQLHDNDRNLFTLYYAGHGRMNSARQAEWVFGQGPNSPFVDWSAIQGLFGTAKSDVLILLDTCAAASSATKSQFAVMETIAACGFERRAPAPGEHSMTNTLIDVMRDWINKPSFSAASLHTEILFRLKLKETKRGRAGIPLEWCVTPIHWINTKDCKASAIELCRLNPLPSSPSATPSGESHDEAESSTYVDPMEIDFDDKSSGSTPLSSVSSDGSYKVPHVLITLQLEENQPLDARECARWLDKFPLLAKWAKVEAVFPSYSTLMILSIPMPIWDLLPDHPACSFIGYSTSPKIEFPPISKEEPVVTVPDPTESSSQALAGVRTENDVEELAVPKTGKRTLIDEDTHDARDLLSHNETRRLVSANLDISRQKHPGQSAKRKRSFDVFDWAPKENLKQGKESLGLPMITFDHAGDRSVVSGIQNFERKKRHSRPKVKMGCSNCRSRRVKCDETRPACIKCVRSGRECNGYQPYGKPIEAIQIKPRPTNTTIIVRQSASVIHRATPLIPPFSVSMVSPMVHQPEGFRFSEEESRYVSVFQEHSMSELAGIFDSKFWTRSVLQSALSEAPIRHAVVALGALYKTLDGVTETPPRSTDSTSLNLATNHYAFALQQYGRAIVQLRTDLENKDARSTRVILMSLVLFACFQCFTGDVKSASSQISHGLRLLDELRQKSRQGLLHSKDGKNEMVEDRLVQVFIRLAVQAKSCDMAFQFPEPYRIWFTPRIGFSSFNVTLSPLFQSALIFETRFEIPFDFTTFQEARWAFDTLWERIIRFTEVLSYYLAGEDDICGKFFQYFSHDFQVQLERWDSAFERLLTARQRSGISTSECVGINALKMTYLTVYILFLMEFSMKQHTNNFFPHFENIIRLAEDVVFKEIPSPTQERSADVSPGTCSPRDLEESHKEIKASFAFDVGIVFPLFTVATKCRDRSLRRAALRLLLSRPRREGMWDSILSGLVAQWIIEIEEEGLSPWVGPNDEAAKEEVAVEKRVIIKEIQFDLQRREATIRYGARGMMKNDPDPDARKGTHHIRW